MQRVLAFTGLGRRWHVLPAFVPALLIAGLTSLASAHSVRPDQVMAQLRASSIRKAFGVVEVRRSRELPRLLVIRVDKRWNVVEVSVRKRAAEEWLRLWRKSMRQGVIAIVDAENGSSLVDFDAHGRAFPKNRKPIVPGDRVQ